MIWLVIKWGVILGGGAWLGLALFALLFANKMIFPAPASSYQMGPEIRMIEFRDDRPPVATLYLPNRNSDYLIFYHHGNGEDLGRILSRLEVLRDLGYSVFAWDYPGYGVSPGKSSEANIYEAAEGLWEFLTLEMEVPPDRIVNYGRSVGGGPATWIARQKPSGGLVLESTFISTFRVMIPVKLLPWDVFDNLSNIKHVEEPVLIMHGTEDTTVPFWHSKRLWEAVKAPKHFAWIEGGGHNNLVEDFPDVYRSSLKKWGAR